MPVVTDLAGNTIVTVLSRAIPHRLSIYAYVWTMGAQATAVFRGQQIFLENMVPMQRLLLHLRFLNRWAIALSALPLIGPVFNLSRRTLGFMSRPVRWTVGRLLQPFRGREYRELARLAAREQLLYGYLTDLKQTVFPVYATTLQILEVVRFYITVVAIVNWIWYNWVRKGSEPKVIYSVTYLEDRLTLVIPYFFFQPSKVIRIYVNRYTLVLLFIGGCNWFFGTALCTGIIYFRLRGVSLLDSLNFFSKLGETLQRYPASFNLLETVTSHAID